MSGSRQTSERERSRRTLVDESIGDTLAPLSMSEQAYGNRDVLAGEHALVVFVGQVPYLCKHSGWQLAAIEDLDSSLAGDDTQFLGVSLKEYLIYKGHLLWRRSELGHDGRAKARVGGGGEVSLEM